MRMDGVKTSERSREFYVTQSARLSDNSCGGVSDPLGTSEFAAACDPSPQGDGGGGGGRGSCHGRGGKENKPLACGAAGAGGTVESSTSTSACADADGVLEGDVLCTTSRRRSLRMANRRASIRIKQLIELSNTNEETEFYDEKCKSKKSKKQKRQKEEREPVDSAASDDSLCEYERQRLVRIEENLAFLASLNLLGAAKTLKERKKRPKMLVDSGPRCHSMMLRRMKTCIST